MKTTITVRGAVLLGKYVACDAFDASMPLRVVTHAHADHMTGLRRSLRTCEKVLMTKATKDLIDVLKDPLFLMGGFVETLDYGKTIRFEEERVTFFRADHILGAAQVLVEDAEGARIVYTGDFRIDGTPVLDADVLVMEATYGSPSCKRSFGRDMRSLLVSLVEKGLKHGTVYVFGYHGKLQEVMQILHGAGVKAPFIVPERVFHVSKVCEGHGMRLGRLMLSEEREARELLEGNSPCIAFYHMMSRRRVGSGGFRVYVSGWEFDSPCREIADKEYVVALSDHSDFDGLMEYVRRSKPNLVIMDNFRVGHAGTLAREIRKRFGISAVALPKNSFVSEFGSF
ncbi:MAG: MBL fold metallo-hydrolase [Candidatus Bathyarchaeia archaeon]|nr:MBL fold metallo-hydrolase [Candidatus Bathyarchaeia archaeon]MDI6905182.1 MBL fold metallo-hydrolase [Candidatus Bathyarchaeia archaeon]